MKSLVALPLEHYLHSLLPARDAVLVEIEGKAARRGIPIVGPAVGRLLLQLTMMTASRRIFEMGSAIGYSSLWFAIGCGREGQVHYSDGDPDKAREAQGYFQRAGLAERLVVHVGDAAAALEDTPGEFDIIFIDIDKHEYPAALDAAAPRLRRGGLLIADNVLWSGRVAETDPDRDTLAIQEFNRKLYAHPDFFTTVVPLRDGIAIAWKLR